LSRKHRGVTGSMQDRAINSSFTPEERLELVTYTDQLTAQDLPPTRGMTAIFAPIIAKKDVFDSWVSRFVEHHIGALTLRWTSVMASDRHAANSYTRYSKYSDMLDPSIAKTKVESEHTYGMDEKSFTVGCKAGARGSSVRYSGGRSGSNRRLWMAIANGQMDNAYIVL
jgi:hypothetical protein